MKLNIIKVSGKRTSSQRSLFIDMHSNPQLYKGYMIYLTAIDNDEIYGIFNKANKFYFNENGVWFESSFNAS